MTTGESKREWVGKRREGDTLLGKVNGCGLLFFENLKGREFS